MKLDYLPSQAKILIDALITPAVASRTFALNMADDSGADNAFTYSAGYWQFDPAKVNGTLLGSISPSMRQTLVRGDSLILILSAFSLPITTAGIVTHVVIGGTVPLLLKVGTDINILNPGSTMQVGSYLACGQTEIRILGAG